MTIRLFETKDAAEVSALIARTLRVTNIKDYSEEYIENDIRVLTPEFMIERAKHTHFYVVCDGETIVGCGAIGPYWGKEDESSLFTIFVLPEYQGRGIGRQIIETLEADDYFLRAKRIEIPASITACSFYRKMGYDYKNGVDQVDEEQLYRLEKHRDCSMSADEQYKLAMKHIYGDGVEEDNARAFALLKEAAAKGHAEAAYNLGVCLHYGYGCEADLPAAYQRYLQSAKAGYGKGMELVGLFHYEGTAVEQDYATAYRWFEKALHCDDPVAVAYAEYLLGRCCERGHGTAQDTAAAIRWYRQSVEHGDHNTDAQDALTRLGY